MINRFIF